MNELNPCIDRTYASVASMRSKADTVLEALNQFLLTPSTPNRQTAQAAMQAYLAEAAELVDC